MDYSVIPAHDGQFHHWQTMLFARLLRHGEELGLVQVSASQGVVSRCRVSGELLELIRHRNEWAENFFRYRQELVRIQAELHAKDRSRAQYQYSLRQAVHQLLGVPPEGSNRFQIEPIPAVSDSQAVPAHLPEVRIWDVHGRRVHLIWFSPHEEEVGPAGLAKHAAACEIQMAVTRSRELPPNAAWSSAVVCSSPHLQSMAESFTGRTVHYRLRWLNSHGLAGRWSRVVAVSG